jgi:hypothetical protein
LQRSKGRNKFVTVQKVSVIGAKFTRKSRVFWRRGTNRRGTGIFCDDRPG